MEPNMPYDFHSDSRPPIPPPGTAKFNRFLFELRQEFKGLCTLGIPDDNRYLTVDGTPMDHAYIDLQSASIKLTGHDWRKVEGTPAHDDAWDAMDDAVPDWEDWEDAGWTVEAYPDENPPQQGEHGFCLLIYYAAKSPEELLDALRWAGDPNVRARATGSPISAKHPPKPKMQLRIVLPDQPNNFFDGHEKSFFCRLDADSNGEE